MDPAKRDKVRFRRRNYFIKKGFQARFMVRFLGLVITASAISGYIMYLLINKDVEDVFYSSHINLSSSGQLLPTLVKVNAWILAVVLLAAAATILLLARKVEGPIGRLGKTAERIAAGDLSGSFSLRTNDEVGSLAGSFEEMNSQLRGFFNEMRRQADAIDRSAERLLADTAYKDNERPGADNKMDPRQVEELQKLIRRLGDNLSKFKTTN